MSKYAIIFSSIIISFSFFYLLELVVLLELGVCIASMILTTAAHI